MLMQYNDDAQEIQSLNQCNHRLESCLDEILAKIRGLHQHTTALLETVDQIKSRHLTKLRNNPYEQHRVERLTSLSQDNPEASVFSIPSSAFPYIEQMTSSAEIALNITRNHHNVHLQSMSVTGFAFELLCKDATDFVLNNQHAKPSHWVFASDNIDPNRTGYLYGTHAHRVRIPSLKPTPWILHAQDMMSQCRRVAGLKIKTALTPWVFLSHVDHELERSHTNYNTTEYLVISLCIEGTGTFMTQFEPYRHPFSKGTVFMHKNDRPNCWKSSDGKPTLILSVRWGFDYCFGR